MKLTRSIRAENFFENSALQYTETLPMEILARYVNGANRNFSQEGPFKHEDKIFYLFPYIFKDFKENTEEKFGLNVPEMFENRDIQLVIPVLSFAGVQHSTDLETFERELKQKISTITANIEILKIPTWFSYAGRTKAKMLKNMTKEELGLEGFLEITNTNPVKYLFNSQQTEKQRNTPVITRVFYKAPDENSNAKLYVLTNATIPDVGQKAVNLYTLITYKQDLTDFGVQYFEVYFEAKKLSMSESSIVEVMDALLNQYKIEEDRNLDDLALEKAIEMQKVRMLKHKENKTNELRTREVSLQEALEERLEAAEGLLSKIVEIQEEITKAKNPVLEEHETDLIEFLTHSKNIMNYYISGTKIYIAVKGYLSVFESDLAYNAQANMRYFKSTPEIKRVFKAVFIDKIAKLKVKQIVSVDLRHGAISTITSASSLPYNEDDDFKELTMREYSRTKAVTNPHLERYNCSGTTKVQVINCIAERNYVGAIATVMNSVFNMNFADDIVTGNFSHYFNDYQNSDNKYFEYEDQEYTLMELNSILVEKEMEEARKQAELEAQTVEMPVENGGTQNV